MKKILYISNSADIGGPEKFLLCIAGIHKETKDNVHYLVLKPGPLVEELKNLDVPYTLLKAHYSFFNPFSIYKTFKEVRSFLNKHQFNILISSMSNAHFIMSMSSIFMRAKRVWFQHGPVGTWKDRLASIFPVDVLLFSSHYLSEKHYSFFFLRKAKYGRKVIPLPVQMESIKIMEAFSIRKKLGFEGKYVIGISGQAIAGNYFELGINSFEELGLPDSKLLILYTKPENGDLNYLNKIKKIIDSSKKKEDIQLIENSNHNITYYKVMDLFINTTTLDEGFGLSVAEAMAASVPVISAPYGGLSEFVKENETAEIIKTRNEDAVESLKLIINKVKSDEIYAKKLSKNAKIMIESRFSFSQTYVALTDIYQYLNSID